MSEGDAGEADFKQLEQAGWQAKAATYDEVVGGMTRGAVEPLLDAVEAGSESYLLDIATGPGYGAAGAAARGAKAVGVDFSAAMVAEARRSYPDLDFRQGDAEALSFGDAIFDAVICPFGLLHFAHPEKAVAEAFRVLKPGGRYAFTVWSTPDKATFFGLVLGAVQMYGSMEVGLPEAPPMFRFSDAGECRRVLAGAGFAEPRVDEIDLTLRLQDPEDARAFIEKGGVRMAMVLERQSAAARESIHQALIDGVKRFDAGGLMELPMAAVLASARKP